MQHGPVPDFYPPQALARKTGWLKRQGKIYAFEFVNSLCFGQMSASRPTLSSQSQSLAQPVSRQALDQRYHPQAVDYLQACLGHVMAETSGLVSGPSSSPALVLALHRA